MQLKFKSLGIPILLLTDAPELLTGLARMGRDLASLLTQMPQFRVGYLGMGGVGRRKFPWCSYSFPEYAGSFGEQYIEEVWHDFAGEDHGIIMSLWDASRMLWFGQPQMNKSESLRTFLSQGRTFAKWGYFPIDATGPDGETLGVGMQQAVAGYDRVLAASEWGAEVLRKSGRPDADWVPHGLWMDRFRIFLPRGLESAIPRTAKSYLGWKWDSVNLGCNMTNQARKDWPVAFETAALLRHEYGNRFRFWVHVDELIRYWNIYALAADFGLTDCIEVTQDKTDEELALRYSACDCTILPSGGEGFGYPVAESMACGTACVVTDYAAAQEIVGEDCRVKSVTYRIDTQHNVQRAVLSGYGFAAAAKLEIEKKRVDWEGRGEEIRHNIEHLDWTKLQHVWKRWLLGGLQ